MITSIRDRITFRHRGAVVEVGKKGPKMVQRYRYFGRSPGRSEPQKRGGGKERANYTEKNSRKIERGGKAKSTTGANRDAKEPGRRI